MKRWLSLLICVLLCMCALGAAAEEAPAADATAPVTSEDTAAPVADVDVTGVWTYDVDLATWFEYKGTDVDGKVGYVWEFKADGTFVQKYADPAKVSEVVNTLMTKILTAEIEAEGVTISTVATAEGHASVEAFVTSIIKKEKLDTLGAAETTGTYTVSGNVLTMTFTDADGKAVEAVDTVTIADGVMTLVGAENETISMTLVVPEAAE